MTRRPLLLALLVAACSRVQRVHESEQQPEQPEEGRGTGGGVPPAPGHPRVPASPQALLRDGVVTEIQQALARRGLLAAHREGDLDDPTSAAIARFQRERGLAATGFPDRETLKDLGIDPEHAYGKAGEKPR